MCDECRWNQHGQCRGRLGGSRGYRCLCRLCVPVFRLVPGRDQGAVAAEDPVPAASRTGSSNGRPALRLVWSDGARVSH